MLTWNATFKFCPVDLHGRDTATCVFDKLNAQHSFLGILDRIPDLFLIGPMAKDLMKAYVMDHVQSHCKYVIYEMDSRHCNGCEKVEAMVKELELVK